MDEAYRQYDLFTSPEELEKENRLQKAVIDIKEKFGKNALLRGMDLQDGATAAERNCQIGGHRSGNQGKDEQRDAGKAVHALRSAERIFRSAAKKGKDHGAETGVL